MLQPRYGWLAGRRTGGGNRRLTSNRCVPALMTGTRPSLLSVMRFPLMLSVIRAVAVWMESRTRWAYRAVVRSLPAIDFSQHVDKIGPPEGCRQPLQCSLPAGEQRFQGAGDLFFGTT